MATIDPKANTKEMSIEERLLALYDLQKVGSAIDKIRTLRGELPLEVQDLEDEIEGLVTRMHNMDAEVKKLSDSIIAKKNEIKESDLLIKKYEAQQSNVRNNREFDSLSKEVEFQNLEKELAEFAKKFPYYDFMRDRGTWTEATNVYDIYKRELHVDHEKHTLKTKSMQFWQAPVEYPMSNVKVDSRTNVAYVDTPEGRHNVGVQYEGKLVDGFETPSKKLDFFVDWMKDWGWPEYAVPMYPKNDEQKKK